MLVVDEFFVEIDKLWPGGTVDKVRLSIIGCGALMLQTDYQRGTKDSDVFETTQLTNETKERLIVLAGIDTALHKQHKLYIDIVANGIPFLPHAPLWRPLEELNKRLTHLELVVLDVVDVVVAKLKPFRPSDQADIDAMIDRDLVPHDRFIERFRDAVDDFSADARAPELRKYLENLHRVERDMFGVPETDIELPSWI